MMKKSDFLEKARNVHGYKYKYLNLADKITLSDKVEIIYDDKLYLQTVSKHLLGRCPEKTISKLSTEDFIKEAKKIWGDKYDYSLTKYEGSLKEIKIIYNGVVYKQRAKSHLDGMSPEFRENEESKIWREISEYDKFGEVEVEEFLKKYQLKFIKKWKASGLEFDFYLPNYRTCIEFDGRQHFEPINHFGGLKTLNKIKKLDLRKEVYCEDNFINLIRIRYDQIEDVFLILWNSLSNYIKE